MFKNFAIAATAIALTAGAASAGSFFGHQDGFSDGETSVEINLVRADAPGMVVLETLQGDVLGSASVNEGANADVLVRIPGKGVNNDVIAKLVIDGEVADVERIQVR
ncbi:MAG: hypothetical protein AAFP28_13670 [Pseudomonadota bacterium]